VYQAAMELSTAFATLVSQAANRDKNAVMAKDIGRLSLIEAKVFAVALLTFQPSYLSLPPLHSTNK
jgi:hypothetical protein